MISKQKGTYDLYDEEARKVLALRNIFENIMNNFNYSFIRTPVFEATELFKRTSGETSDVVSKEMYEFKDKKDRSLALRPEGTASVARCFIENKLYTDLPRKFWYFEPMYRYDRPQKGRYREHFQFGCEAYGSNDPSIDAEIISIPYHLFETLGLEGVKVRINTLGDNESRENYKKALIDYLEPHIDSLCEDCKERFKKNPLRILDCKVDGDKDIIKNAPKIADYLNEESLNRYNKLKEELDLLEINYEENTNLVRGLDYYNHVVFEINVNIDGIDTLAIGGGGRYNNLVESLDGPSVPAVGFAIGFDRLMMCLDMAHVNIPVNNDVDVYIMYVSDTEKDTALYIAQNLRLNGFTTEMDYLGKGLKGQFKAADRFNAKYLVILNDKDLEDMMVNVKDNLTKEEEKVNINDLSDYLDMKL